MTREYPKNNSPENIALPTVGRIVYFYNSEGSEPLPAIVTKLGDVDYLVDLQVFGDPRGEYTKNTPHVVANADFGKAVGYWDWMPYQKGQAAKTEELEKKLSKQEKPTQPHERLGNQR